MRRKVVAGNWKMNNNLSESVTLISELKNGLGTNNLSADVIICPPYTALETASTLLKGSQIKLGSQNIYFEESGAFTGEISASMLKSVGCEYAIVGHSERRAIFGEDNDLLNKKLKQALKNDLLPIYCVGETLGQREKGITNKIIEEQIREGLSGIVEADFRKIIIAYEPVWAIGTGKTATPQQAQDIHQFIRGLISNIYSSSVSDQVRILYGGSVKPNNSAELLSQPDIDGALVGGACLKADSFIDIIKSA